MKLYKVIFEHNKPVSATAADAANPGNEDGNLLTVNENTRWLLVLGFDEQDSLDIARMLLDDEAA